MQTGRASGRGGEDDVPHALRGGARLAFVFELRLPGRAEIITHGGGLGKRRIRVQALESAVHLDVHAVLIGALPDVRSGVLFFAPPRPSIKTTTHRAERRLAPIRNPSIGSHGARLRCLFALIAHVTILPAAGCEKALSRHSDDLSSGAGAGPRYLAKPADHAVIRRVPHYPLASPRSDFGALCNIFEA